MNELISVLRLIHIVSGGVALITGLIAVIAVKGSSTHIVSGRVFFTAMIAVAASALCIAIPGKSYYLQMIAVFAFYQSYNGFRAIRNKELKATIPDWIIQALSVINAILMISSMNITLIVFGIISLLLTVSMVRTFFKTSKNMPLKPYTYLSIHIGNMIGAFISTVTAFLVVNIKGIEPAWIIWLGPTFVLVPLIFYFQKIYTSTGSQ